MKSISQSNFVLNSFDAKMVLRQIHSVKLQSKDSLGILACCFDVANQGENLLLQLENLQRKFHFQERPPKI